MPIPLLSGFSGPVDRFQTLQPVVFIPITSSPFDQQFGDFADVSRPFKLAELRITASDAVRAGAFHLACPALLIQ